MNARLERVVRQTLDDRFGSDADLAAAIVAAVLDELQLREQWADAGADGELDEWACGHPIVASSRQPAVHDGYDTPVQRLVTPWVRAEEQR